MSGTLARRRALLSLGGAVAGAAGALGGAVPAALAGEEWCSDDPEVVITTPAGHTVVVHVTNYGRGARYLPAVAAARTWHARQAVPGQAATDVWVYSVIPNYRFERFDVRAVTSTGLDATGTILASAAGRSGDKLTMYFRLAVP